MDFLGKISEILRHPSRFFHRLNEGSILPAFYYFLPLFLGYVACQYAQRYDSLSGMMSFSVISGFFVISYLLGIGFFFLGVGILHLWIKIWGGKGNYAKTFQISAYAETPTYLIYTLIFIGYLIGYLTGEFGLFYRYLGYTLMFIGAVYSLILLMIGTAHMHKISRAKTILMYAIPFTLILAWVLTFYF